MTSKLPSINLIKKRNINLTPKPIFKKEQIKKLDKNKFFSRKLIKNKAISLYENDNFNNLKKIGLSSLLYRKPKKIFNQQILNSNKKVLSNFHRYKQTRILDSPIIKSSSVKLYPTGSSLKRLTIGNFDEIQKFTYYKRIEDSKSYQDYLLKERAYIPQESIDNSFVESSDERETSNKPINKKKVYLRNSIYDKLNPLNKKNMIKIKTKIKNQDIFEKFIIEKYIKNKINDINGKDFLLNKKRNIFILLDGEIIINEYEIKGYFLELPNFHEIKFLSDEKREKILKNILKKSDKIFKRKRPLMTIYSPNKEFISDIKEIKKDFKYLYVSSNIICKGVSLVITPNFLKLYKKDFKNYLKIERINNNIEEDYPNEELNKKYKFKLKGIIQGIKPKYEIYKPHYSFGEGENQIENEEYIAYSDNEERKAFIKNNILNNCYFKNDFFLYINEKNTRNKISELKTKLKYDKPFDLRESYNKFIFNFDKIIERYKKEVQKQLKINPKIYKIDQIDANINSHNLKFPKDQLTNLYINRKNKKHFKKELTNNSFYSNIDKNVTKYYTPFILYNIPKILSELKNFTRQRLYEIYTQYKDLMVMSYAKNKSDFILKNGVDFDSFWLCVENLSDEKQKFVEKIYNQINRSKLCLLNMEDFMRGMYFIQNTEITEKLDLFLKALDFSGKGVITFKEAVEICKDSIQRNLSDNKKDNDNNIYALNELSQFFATFIFKLIGVNTNKILRLDDLKKAILQKNNEFNEIEYLEMFCGANK